MGKKQRATKGGKFTIVFTDEERAALEQRAKKERVTPTALIRRLVMGLAGLLLIACGGADFSADKAAPEATAGAGQMGDAGAGNSPGATEGHLCNTDVPCAEGLFCDGDGRCSLKSDIGGACSNNSECTSNRCVGQVCKEPPPPYDGPAWIDCSDGSAVTMRGLSGPISDFTFEFTAESIGPGYSIWASTPQVNGGTENLPEFYWDVTNVTATSQTGAATFPGDTALRSADVITMQIGWSPKAGGMIPTAQVSHCSVSREGAVIASWSASSTN